MDSFYRNPPQHLTWTNSMLVTQPEVVTSDAPLPAKCYPLIKCTCKGCFVKFVWTECGTLYCVRAEAERKTLATSSELAKSHWYVFKPHHLEVVSVANLLQGRVGVGECGCGRWAA